MLQEFSNISLEERAVLNVEEKNKILSDSIRSIEEPLIEDCGFDDPLDMARYNEVDYFKRLSHQELKSSARACDCYGNTALHMASANGHNGIYYKVVKSHKSIIFIFRDCEIIVR